LYSSVYIINYKLRINIIIHLTWPPAGHLCSRLDASSLQSDCSLW
jgi:hypothetical protein